jgi:outer membrane receptor for Fe3+-dicitrate
MRTTRRGAWSTTGRATVCSWARSCVTLASSFSDYANTVLPGVDGDVGVIPAFTLWNAHVGCMFMADRGSEITLTFGIRNITDTSWISRTDDRNG